MAKPKRVVPSTPQPRPETPASEESSTSSQPAQPTPRSRPPANPKSPRPAPTIQARVEPEHVVTGTRCVAGHTPGAEFDAGRMGILPTRKQAFIGFGLVAWCLGGLAVMAMTGIAEGAWVALGVQFTAAWFVLAAVFVHRGGHRRRCWRTRTWRHAWGGLAPGSGRDSGFRRSHRG